MYIGLAIMSGIANLVFPSVYYIFQKLFRISYLMLLGDLVGGP